ncbi:RmlC-like cupin domain-containing protein [Thelonectria olida]|uniref:RmlC-like cupin domain-containing protein n=1 Tax=Thelonectria olida TaxID=1576542 RepID=A0A9P8W8D2_9HYPO|nr:RmlC-like cupin domain-containing protein [Thelonectria olida]
MSRFTSLTGIFVATISILIIIYTPTNQYFSEQLQRLTNNIFPTTNNTNISNIANIPTSSEKQMLNTAKNMSKSLRNAKITPHRSSTRGHSDHGWLNTYHSFSFADWYDPRFSHFGSLRVLNEDRVKANSGFPTHPHRDFEIFSYILGGELTHRDSMLAKGKEGGQSDKFFRMRRGDVQFTTGGTGIAHSEMNEHKTDTVHFLQIWATPWKRGLPPQYHTRHFDEEAKRQDFVKILSPLKGGEDATAEQEKAAEAVIPDTIPIHADFVMAAGIIPPEKQFEWTIGGGATTETKRKVFVHVPMTKGGKAKIRLDGREDAELAEGDGAFIEGINIGDKLSVESIGEVEAEVVVLDTA